MPQRADTFDVGALRLSSGEGRRLVLHVPIGTFELAGERYDVKPSLVEARLDLSRMAGSGYALRLRFDAGLTGPCMRCLRLAEPVFRVDAHEVDRPGGGEELSSPYLQDDVLRLSDWARDALALTLPAQIVCRHDCAGLCAECGEDLNDAGPGHVHEREPDPRWAKLRELKLD